MSKGRKKTLAVVLALGIVIMLDGLFKLGTSVWLLKRGDMTVGTCTAVYSGRRSDTAEIQYEVDERLYSIKANNSSIREGNTVAVWYMPENPEAGRVVNVKKDVLSVLVGAVVACVGWKGKWRNKQGVRISHGGITFSDKEKEDEADG